MDIYHFLRFSLKATVLTKRFYHQILSIKCYFKLHSGDFYTKSSTAFFRIYLFLEVYSQLLNKSFLTY
jgi:hypothetical protein